MIEAILTLIQHNPDGTARTLIKAGGFQFAEHKSNSTSILNQLHQHVTNAVRYINGLPELDDNLLTTHVNETIAQNVLELIVKQDIGKIEGAYLRDDKLTIHITLTKDLINELNNTNSKP